MLLGDKWWVGGRRWRDAKKWNREEKEKYGIHISNFEKRKEKCRDLFSGSRREREFLQKIIEKSAIFSNFEKRKRNFENKSHDSRGDRDVEISNFSWRERGVLTSNSRIKIVFWRILSLKCFCWLKLEYCSTTQSCLFKILSLSAKHCWSKSNQIAKCDFSPKLEEKLRE